MGGRERAGRESVSQTDLFLPSYLQANRDEGDFVDRGKAQTDAQVSSQ